MTSTQTGHGDGRDLNRSTGLPASGASTSKEAVTIDRLIALLEAGDVKNFNRLRPEGELNLTGLDLSERELKLDGVNFENCILKRASLSGVSLKGARFFNADLTGADLSYTALHEANFSEAKAIRADFSHAEAPKAQFHKARLDASSFDRTVLEGAEFVEARLARVIMREVMAFDADFTAAKILSATLLKSKFAGAIFEGTSFAQSSLTGSSFGKANLHGANLSRISGKDVNFEQANLCSARMVDAEIIGKKTSFKGAYVFGLRTDPGLREEYFGNAKNEAPPESFFRISRHTVADSALVNGIPGSDRARFERAWKDLDSMIGLKDLKRHVRSLIRGLQIDARARQLGEPVEEFGHHYAFVGEPGTGKTQVMRIMGDLLSSLGLLESGHLVEVQRGHLVKTKIGHTGPNTREKIESAMGGVFGLDEAYNLVRESENDFGIDAYDEIMDLTENRRGDFVGVFCGYEDEMTDFMARNPGFASRITHVFNFGGNNPGELTDIGKSMLDGRNKNYDPEFVATLSAVCAIREQTDGRAFGNGRFVRDQFVGKTLAHQKDRLVEEGFLDSDDRIDQVRAYRTLVKEDIPLKELIGLEHDELDLSKLEWTGAAGGGRVQLSGLDAVKGDFPQLTKASMDYLKSVCPLFEAEAEEATSQS